MNNFNEKEPLIGIGQKVPLLDCLVKMMDWLRSKPKGLEDLNEVDIKEGEQAVNLLISKILIRLKCYYSIIFKKFLIRIVRF